ncbi:MAG TPA: hypothetical protein VD993_06310 [Chitinophagaceae bacterium]|nr:hypothetical protein [Chitinophagaceae bacterium]
MKKPQTYLAGVLVLASLLCSVSVSAQTDTTRKKDSTLRSWDKNPARTGDVAYTYIDLNSGDTLDYWFDTERKTVMNRTTGRPVEFYINTTTGDTVYGRGRFVINGLLLQGDDGKWKFDESKVKIDGDELKIKDGNRKLKIDGDEIKIKEGGRKIKLDGDEGKLKDGNTKAKMDKDKMKVKDEQGKAKYKEDKTKIKEGDMKIKKKGDSTKIKSDSLRLNNQ